MSKPGMGDLLDLTSQQAAEKQRGPVPAAVVKYFPDNQTIDAQPLVYPFINGEAQELPEVKQVPVAFPQAANISITWPLAPGDLVYLVPAEGDISAWLSRGVQGPASSKRRADLSDSVALPGIASLANPLPAEAFAADALVLRANLLFLGASTASDFVALASLVLNRLQTIVNWANTHGHPPPFGSPPATPIYPTGVPPVASSKVHSE